MAKLSGRGNQNTPHLKALAFVISSFDWKLTVVEERIGAALGLKKEFGHLEIEKVLLAHGVSDWMISWRFVLGCTGVPGEDEERLQSQAESILAIFNEMEEKVKAAQVVEEPLSWLQPQQEKDLVEACCAIEPSSRVMPDSRS